MRYKFFIPIILSIFLGLFFGKIFFEGYDKKTIPVFYEKNKIYFLQIGVYSNLDKLKNNFENYKKLLYEKEEDGYHLYVGITKNKAIAKKIKDYYENNGYSIYIKEKVVNNNSFLSILGEYDKIVNITSDNDIVDIERIVLSNYKEMVLENED